VKDHDSLANLISPRFPLITARMPPQEMQALRDLQERSLSD
jgi:hypothetical protein